MSAVFTPSATPLSVRCKTSHADAVKFTHVPVTEITCPAKNRRKFARSQRVERPVDGAADGGHRPPSVSRSKISAARSRTSRSSSGRRLIRLARYSSFRRRVRCRSLRPSGVTWSHAIRPSSGSDVRSIKPAGLQGGQQPGHRGLLDLFVRGERPGGHRAVALDRAEGGQQRGRDARVALTAELAREPGDAEAQVRREGGGVQGGGSGRHDQP